MTFTLNSSSFIAIGFGGSMYDADMISSWTGDGNQIFVDDFYSSSESEPQLDIDLGGENNVKFVQGSFSENRISVTVVRLLSTGDKPYDKVILPSGANDMIYAWGAEDSKGISYHGDNHNHIHVDFSKVDGIPDTVFGYEESGGLSRDLIAGAYYGTLSTWQSEAAGSSTVFNFPFGSVADIADDGKGRPLMLLSLLERNVINIQAYAPCSLHVTTSPNTTIQLNFPEYFDVMTKPRTTLLGRLEAVPSDELDDARSIYLAKHPTSKAWITFSDFIMYRMVIEDVYVVGGFGNEHYIGWISPEQYLSVSSR